MADPTYLVTDDAAYDPSIRALQDSDPASASEIFNPLVQQLVTNAHANYKAIQALEQRGPTLSIPVRLKGSVTISSPTQEVDLGITGGLTAEDDLDLYIDSLHADEGVDYTRGADGTSLVTFAQPLVVGKVVQYKAERFIVADHGTQLAEDILSHMAATDNPHRVTAEQVGAPTKDYVDDLTHTVSLTSTASFSSANIKVSKAGHIVSVTAGYVSNYKKASAEYDTFCILPEGFRPSIPIDIVVPTMAERMINIMVDTAGCVKIGVFGDVGVTTSIRVNFSFSQ